MHRTEFSASSGMPQCHPRSDISLPWESELPPVHSTYLDPMGGLKYRSHPLLKAPIHIQYVVFLAIEDSAMPALTTNRAPLWNGRVEFRFSVFGSPLLQCFYGFPIGLHFKWQMVWNLATLSAECDVVVVQSLLTTPTAHRTNTVQSGSGHSFQRCKQTHNGASATLLS